MSEHESICSYGGHPYPTSGVCPNCMIIMQARIEGTGQPPPTGPLGPSGGSIREGLDLDLGWIDEIEEPATGDPITDSGSLSPMQRGNAFNAARAFDYPYREVYVHSPKGDGAHVRLDAYMPGEEIVSRKFTQLAEHPKDAIKHIYELVTKYPQGAFIADVPSSKGLEKTGELSGLMLEGQHILEIPCQVNPIPLEVLDVARANGVVIREDTGPRYLPED